MRLPPNEKLTPLVAGRMVQSMTRTGDVLQLTLDDGSFMKVRTGGPAPALDAMVSRTIIAVRQAGTEMALEFEDHSTAVIKLAEETSSVMLRDKDQNFAYAD